MIIEKLTAPEAQTTPSTGKQPEALKLALSPTSPFGSAPSQNAPATVAAPMEALAAAASLPLQCAPATFAPNTEGEAGRVPVAKAQSTSRSPERATVASVSSGRSQASSAADAKPRVSASDQAAAVGQKLSNGSSAQEPSGTPVKAVPSISADAAAFVTATAGAGPVADKPVSAPTTPDTENTAAQPAVEADSAEVSGPQAGSSINVARVVESMRGSEMHVGMRTEEFGTISVTTSVNREQIATQISFDHGDLGHLLATHLPGMQEKLGSDTGLHATIEVLDRGGSGQQTGSFSGSFSGQSGAGESGARQQSAASRTGFIPGSQAGAFVPPPGEGAESAVSTRLDVRI